MKSQWITGQQINAPHTSKSELAKKIDELIGWYQENASRKEDDYIQANLKLIIHLAENVEDSDDIIFIEKIVDTFCDIIKKQREVIQELEFYAATQPLDTPSQQCNYIPSYETQTQGFTDDEQIKASFLAYMKNEGRTDFTANDYILRIQNLWRSFYADHKDGELPKELDEDINEELIQSEYPLLNAYNYIEELNRYVSIKLEGAESSRNWANIRAALNRFGDAMHGEDFKKAKSGIKTNVVKDFSKYIFEGNTYGKSRLVLAVVKKYVEDHQPTTFDELESVFPSHIQGSLGVVRRIEDVSDKYKGIGGVKRYFVDDVIYLASGEQVIVCTQFGATNTEKFVEHVTNELGYAIEKV
jgi:hypothetical protein